MAKEDMIRHILKGLASDLYSLNPADLERKLKNERIRLDQITYSEVEELFYIGNLGAPMLQI